MRMSKTKQPHFVPRLILRNFTDSAGLLHCFDKRTKCFYSTTPARAFRKSGLHSQQVEDQLGGVESQFGPVVRKVIHHAGQNEWPGLSRGETSALRSFLMIQLRRTPEFLALYKQLIARQVGRPLTTDEERAIEQAWANSHSLELTDEVETAFRSKGVGAGRVLGQQKALVIGSHPVAVSCPNGIPITHPEAAFHMAISPDIALGLLGGDDEKVTLGWLDEELVDRLNLDVLQRSYVIASHGSKLTKSVAKMMSSTAYKDKLKPPQDRSTQ